MTLDVNTVFSNIGDLVNALNSNLPTIPTTPSSIQLYRNGIIQQQSATGDYTFTGSTITFLAASIPQTGDTLIVWYY
jgi:hypothetical protein